MWRGYERINLFRAGLISYTINFIQFGCSFPGEMATSFLTAKHQNSRPCRGHALRQKVTISIYFHHLGLKTLHPKFYVAADKSLGVLGENTSPGNAVFADVRFKMADFLFDFHDDVKRIFCASWDDERACRISCPSDKLTPMGRVF